MLLLMVWRYRLKPLNLRRVSMRFWYRVQGLWIWKQVIIRKKCLSASTVELLSKNHLKSSLRYGQLNEFECLKWVEEIERVNLNFDLTKREM